jgi:hypothetical protein
MTNESFGSGRGSQPLGARRVYASAYKIILRYARMSRAGQRSIDVTDRASRRAPKTFSSDSV